MVRELLLSEKKNETKYYGKCRGRFLQERALSLGSKVKPVWYTTAFSSWVTF